MGERGGGWPQRAGGAGPTPSSSLGGGDDRTSQGQPEPDPPAGGPGPAAQWLHCPGCGVSVGVVGVPQVADPGQAAAVHLQDAVPQRQLAVGGRRAAREQGLDVEAGGAQGRVLWGHRGLRALWPRQEGGPATATSAPPSASVGRLAAGPGCQCVFECAALDPAPSSGPARTPRPGGGGDSRPGRGSCAALSLLHARLQGDAHPVPVPSSRPPHQGPEPRGHSPARQSDPSPARRGLAPAPPGRRSRSHGCWRGPEGTRPRKPRSLLKGGGEERGG